MHYFVQALNALVDTPEVRGATVGISMRQRSMSPLVLAGPTTTSQVAAPARHSPTSTPTTAASRRTATPLPKTRPSTASPVATPVSAARPSTGPSLRHGPLRHMARRIKENVGTRGMRRRVTTVEGDLTAYLKAIRCAPVASHHFPASSGSRFAPCMSPLRPNVVFTPSCPPDICSLCSGNT
jgi:hypothetical protein